MSLELRQIREIVQLHISKDRFSKSDKVSETECALEKERQA